MFNHLIPLCWNTTTEHLEVPSCQRAQMFWSSSTMLIRYSLLQRRNVCTGPQQWGAHADICSVSGAAVENLPNAAAWRMLWTWPWQRARTLRPEEGQETVGSWSTEVVPGTFPHASGSSSFSLVCGWSVRLHHFTPGERREGGGMCRLTVEVGENFSEGIHCPLTERTA